MIASFRSSFAVLTQKQIQGKSNWDSSFEFIHWRNNLNFIYCVEYFDEVTILVKNKYFLIGIDLVHGVILDEIRKVKEFVVFLSNKKFAKIYDYAEESEIIK